MKYLHLKKKLLVVFLNKDKLLKSVNAVLGHQKYKHQKIKQEEHLSLLEKYYLESKTQQDNGLNPELPKKRL